MMPWTKGIDSPPQMEERASAHFPSNAEFCHSTPVKKKNVCALWDAGQPSVLTSFKLGSSPVPADSVQDMEFPVKDLSGSTIQRQRRELQLLMAELKDRDRELNTMAASHHKQLHAWEQDRQRVLTLEQRCSQLEEELRKRNEVIRVLTKRVWVVETREEEVQKELSTDRQQLCELEQKLHNISQKCEDVEEKNQSLNSTVMALSSQVGSLQVREEELSSMLKLKDKDVTEASGHIVDLRGHLRGLETSLAESHSKESKLLKDLEESKRRYREAKHGISHLKEEVQQQLTQSSTQREEIIRLKQELQLLRRDLALSGEGDSWKDELLELARSKQERTMSELRCLRQVCETQRNDLQLLQLNLESAHESLREKTSQVLGDSQDELKCGCLDKSSPSSFRAKNSRLFPAAAKLQGTVNDDLGVFSAHLMDGDAPLSSCSLQQLLEESRQVVTTGSEHSSSTPHCSVLPTLTRGTPDNLYAPKCKTSHQRPPASRLKASETPPRACLQHQPDSWMS